MIEPLVYQSLESIHARLEAQQRVFDMLVKLAADFLACDLRPMLISAGGSIERIGDDPVPPQLREHLQREGESLGRLRYAYALARQQRAAEERDTR